MPLAKPSDTQLFPGSDAGASLKPALPCCVVGHHVLFPGSDAGASLKHRRGQPRPVAPRNLFPGSDAGASLKQALAGVVVHAGQLFPGSDAGASLKQPCFKGAPF